MWFKNLQLYRLTEPFVLSAEQLNEKLSRAPFRSCGDLELSSYGWVPPLGQYGTELVHAANGYLMVCARKEEKVLPAAVVREAVDNKAAAIEEEQGRPVRRKQRVAIRDEVIQDLLPRAFTRSSLTYAYLAPHEGWLIVDAASPRKAEQLVSFLCRSLGGLPLALPAVRQPPSTVMTHWLNSETLPADITISDECELHVPAEGGSIARLKRQDLTAEEVGTHIEAGKQVVRLAITWDQRLSCVLGSDLSIKRLRFEDMVQEQLKDLEADDAATRFDADFAIMTLELSRFLRRLLELFGGEDTSAYRALGQAA